MASLWTTFTVAAALAIRLAAQTGPQFEVASVRYVGDQPRVIDLLSGGPGTSSPTRITAQSTPLAMLVTTALGVRRSEVVGLAIPNSFLSIAATISEGASKDDLAAMLRNMLVERFGLRYHRETREVKSFELRQDPRGHKMKDSTHDAPPKRGESFSIGSRFGADGYLEYPTGVTIRAGFKGRWRWQSVQQPMEDIVRQLDGMLGGPVANKTGLDGNYDFVLSYSQEMAATPEAAENEFSFPPLRAALRDQLGLIAVETKGPMELIVIDAINKTPTEN